MIKEKIVDEIGIKSYTVLNEIIEQYISCLTANTPQGDIWMKIDHKYIMQKYKTINYWSILEELIEKDFIRKDRKEKNIWWQPNSKKLREYQDEL